MESPKKKRLLEAHIITLGNGQVGKTSLIFRFVENNFSPNYLFTVGIDSKFKRMKLKNGEEIRVQITDTAGQERYRSLSTNYIKKADGILFVYDITKKESFDEIDDWLERLNKDENNNRPHILIGNKSDLNDLRKISIEEGMKLANEKNMHFYETSCKTGENVEISVMDLVEQIYSLKKGIKDNKKENIKLEKKEKNKKEKKNSC